MDIELRRIALGLVSAAFCGASGVAGQTVTLDEGTFRVTVGGRDAGTETFSIRQNGTGPDAVVIARGRVAGTDELSSSLQLAGGVRPAAYEVTARGGDGQRIAGRMVGGRFSARIVSSAGEEMREYLVSEGAVLVDEGIAHHYYFLSRGLDGSARVPLLIPRESRQVWANVSVQGTENVTIGGRSIAARRLVVSPEGGSDRTVWVDEEGRVLRVRIPALQYEAERTTAPS